MAPQASQEVQSFTTRSSTNRLLDEQQHQFGTGSWHISCAHNLIAHATVTSTKQKKAPDTFCAI